MEKNLQCYFLSIGAGIAQSVYRQARLDGQDSIPCRGNIFFSTSQGPDWLWAHPASYKMGTVDSFPRSEVAEA
jgi:hypothetical protein